MSGSVGMFVCLFVSLFICVVPWPESRLRSYLYHMIENLSKAKDYANLISSDTMRHNYATFHKSTTFDISILNFKIQNGG